MSDGTIILVRGHDYHVDVVLPNGTRKFTDTLPFDWKHLTDDDKHRLMDSTRVVIEKIRDDAVATKTLPTTTHQFVTAGPPPTKTATSGCCPQLPRNQDGANLCTTL